MGLEYETTLCEEPLTAVRMCSNQKRPLLSSNVGNLGPNMDRAGLNMEENF